MICSMLGEKYWLLSASCDGQKTAIMQSPRLWKVSVSRGRQPPVSSGKRTLRHFHNHSVFMKAIRVSGSRLRGVLASGSWSLASPAPFPSWRDRPRHPNGASPDSRGPARARTGLQQVHRRGAAKIDTGGFRRPAKLCRACRRVSSDQAACGPPLTTITTATFHNRELCITTHRRRSRCPCQAPASHHEQTFRR